MVSRKPLISNFKSAASSSFAVAINSKIIILESEEEGKEEEFQYNNTSCHRACQSDIDFSTANQHRFHPDTACFVPPAQ